MRSVRTASSLFLFLTCTSPVTAELPAPRNDRPVALSVTCAQLALWNANAEHPIELPVMCTIVDGPTPFGQTDPPTLTPVTLDGAAQLPPSSARRPPFPPPDKSPGRRAGSPSRRGGLR
jgi:hypothetical protein